MSLDFDAVSWRPALVALAMAGLVGRRAARECEEAVEEAASRGRGHRAHGGWSRCVPASSGPGLSSSAAVEEARGVEGEQHGMQAAQRVTVGEEAGQRQYHHVALGVLAGAYQQPRGEHGHASSRLLAQQTVERGKVSRGPLSAARGTGARRGRCAADARAGRRGKEENEGRAGAVLVSAARCRVVRSRAWRVKAGKGREQRPATAATAARRRPGRSWYRN